MNAIHPAPAPAGTPGIAPPAPAGIPDVAPPAPAGTPAPTARGGTLGHDGAIQPRISGHGGTAQAGAPGDDPGARTGFLEALAARGPALSAHANALDQDARFPVEDIAALAQIGVLTAPFPELFGGLGLGTDPRVAHETSAALQSLGAAHVALGRLIEAHINAVRLICLYGTPDQLARAARDAAEGYLIGLWVTDAPDRNLALDSRNILRGGKEFCSGAGELRRALVTARLPDGGDQLLYLIADPARSTPLPGSLSGVRCARTGRTDFDGLAVAASDRIGRPGDYLREPAFSAGAWRTAAVTAGGLAALVDEMIDRLAAAGRAQAPLQQARIGQAIIARETARLWLGRIAPLAEDPDPDGAEDRLTQVHLARIAIESACVQVLNLAERALGLQAYRTGATIERLRRDLSTYLRQPAPDEILAIAADHAMLQRASAQCRRGAGR